MSLPIFVIMTLLVISTTMLMSRWLGLEGRVTLGLTICVGILVVMLMMKHPCSIEITESFSTDDVHGKEQLPIELTNKLKLYLSVFGKNSYKDGALIWNDISNNKDDISKCSGTRDFSMSESPMVDDIKGGLGLRNVVLTGPRSEDLGLVGSGDFTFYWYSKNLSEVSSSPIPVLTMYSNTPSNIALQVSIKQVGSQSYMVVENSLDGASLASIEVALTGSFSPSSGACSFAIVRSSGTLQVFFNDAPQGSPIVCGKERVLLSNRRVNINTTGKWDCKLSVFAVYRRALSSSDIVGITAYIRKRLVLLDDEYRSLLQQKEQLESKKKCPIKDVDVCRLCSAIVDWSNPINFLQNASVECKEAINQYCSNNPNDEFCSCWGEGKKTTACEVMRSFFDQSTSNVAKECEVRKLYPHSKEPSLDKYYMAVSPLQMAASMVDIPIPDDVVVDWMDESPMNVKSPSPLITLEKNIPDDKIVEYFPKVQSLTIGNVAI